MEKAEGDAVILTVSRRTIRRRVQAVVAVAVLIILLWGLLAAIWRLWPSAGSDERWRDRPLPEQPLRVSVSGHKYC